MWAYARMAYRSRLTPFCLSRFQFVRKALISDAARENLYAGHSRFIAEATRNDKWADGVGNSRKGGDEGIGEEVDDIPQGKGEQRSFHAFG